MSGSREIEREIGGERKRERLGVSGAKHRRHRAGCVSACWCRKGQG